MIFHVSCVKGTFSQIRSHIQMAQVIELYNASHQSIRPYLAIAEFNLKNSTKEDKDIYRHVYMCIHDYSIRVYT